MQVNSYSKVCHALNMAISALKAYKAPDSDTDGFKAFVADLESALHTPRRNCDVGTAAEQAKRFAEYCDSETCKRNRCKFNAKALCIERCALAWAQMPYEEGGVE